MRGELKREAIELRDFHRLATAIYRNSKGEVLLTALRQGFELAAKVQDDQQRVVLQEKAVIFTESRRTQEYLFTLLNGTELHRQYLPGGG